MFLPRVYRHKKYAPRKIIKVNDHVSVASSTMFIHVKFYYSAITTSYHHFYSNVYLLLLATRVSVHKNCT